MYLHVGNNRNIRVRDLVGIFDADTATVATVTKRYLSAAQAEGAVEFASIELPKSFVLYRREKSVKRKDRAKKRVYGTRAAREKARFEYRICFSQLSSAALAGRVENGSLTGDQR